MREVAAVEGTMLSSAHSRKVTDSAIDLLENRYLFLEIMLSP
jgi:hypothetical protein